jgi:hypothetical protein
MEGVDGSMGKDGIRDIIDQTYLLIMVFDPAVSPYRLCQSPPEDWYLMFEG